MPQRLRAWHGSGLGFSPFAHHYLGYLLRFLFLGVLRCFTSPGCRLFKRLTGCPVKVAPFRDPRVNGCLLLSAAFRSLLRLSSAFSAKAFPSCYVYLNLINPLWTFFTKAFFNSSFPKLFCFIPSLLSWFVRLENEELEGFELSVLERFAIILLRHLVPLLRKEVIQPHLPVRLPCYDFTPLTRRTLDASLLCRLSLRLWVPPTRVV